MINRFFAGFFGTAPLAVGGGVFVDLFDNKTRGIAVRIHMEALDTLEVTKSCIPGDMVHHLRLHWPNVRALYRWLHCDKPPWLAMDAISYRNPGFRRCSTELDLCTRNQRSIYLGEEGSQVAKGNEELRDPCQARGN